MRGRRWLRRGGGTPPKDLQNKLSEANHICHAHRGGGVHQMALNDPLLLGQRVAAPVRAVAGWAFRHRLQLVDLATHVEHRAVEHRAGLALPDRAQVGCDGHIPSRIATFPPRLRLQENVSHPADPVVPQRPQRRNPRGVVHQEDPVRLRVQAGCDGKVVVCRLNKLNHHVVLPNLQLSHVDAHHGPVACKLGNPDASLADGPARQQTQQG
mmetsp:Transcript_12217/g.47228  ORF Transcript_12217/g.47228 Transcript_12217/m.47228 type:complete len:211 (+) Transcript_12217:160-792(+)